MNEQQNINPMLVIQSLTSQIADMAQKIAVLEAMLNQQKDSEQEKK